VAGADRLAWHYGRDGLQGRGAKKGVGRVRMFHGQVAVVTGAASGIGRQLASDLVARGALVYGIDIDELEADGNIKAIHCDLSDTDAYRSLLVDLEREHGHLDLLANVAGIDRPVSVASGDFERYESILRVNFLAPLAGTLTVLPGMLARRHGYVVNVSSDSVRSPIAGASAYIASKGALTGFSESAALEAKSKGVHVHVLYPGFVYSPMGQEAIEHGMKPPPKMTVRTPEQLSALILKRLGGPGTDINAVRMTLVTPVLKTVMPSLYRRMMAARSMPTDPPGMG
jgi:NAD(P)-dependent dehydrogenase (short-subunit alcohol dehydrogenase family)